MNYLDKEKQKMKKHEQYLKRKASETKEQRDKRLARGREYRQKMKNSNPGQNQAILSSVQNIAAAVEKQKIKKHEQYLKIRLLKRRSKGTKGYPEARSTGKK